MAEDNVVVAFQSLAKAIDDLIAEYGADRPDHQYQPLMLPMIDVKRIRAAIAAQAHEPSADVVERVGIALCQKALGGKQCPCAATGVFRCADEHPGEMATAAIAAMRPESERVGIVAWLRSLPNDEWYPDHVADALERGDYIKEPSHD